MRSVLDKHKFGPWAVVTGSSSGIGRAMMGAMIGQKFARKAFAISAATPALPPARIAAGGSR
jgi:NAD(P)-dependent dehydrogenase (short-subunit alcohol dehydrogenase family)